jgi:ATP-dependent RNA helicase RhlE
VHRIGRTARAGASGVAVSFCDPEEVSNLKAIERLIRKPIAVKKDHPVYTERAAETHGGRDSHRDHDSRREPRHQPASANRHSQPKSRSHAPAQTARPHSPRPSHASARQPSRGNHPLAAGKSAFRQSGARPGSGVRRRAF